MTNEIDFIKQFLGNFSDFNNYDKQTLGVYADWLQERNDPREELVRMCYQAQNLLYLLERSNLAKKLGIPSLVRVYVGHGDNNNSYEFYLVSDKGIAISDTPEFIIDGKHGNGWYFNEDIKIEINRISNDVLLKFFWSLLGYGWNFTGTAANTYPVNFT